MDMSKAFDKVSHAALVAKLERYNISGYLLDWFSSYLYNCRQRVTTLGATSSEKPVSSIRLHIPVLFCTFPLRIPSSWAALVLPWTFRQHKFRMARAILKRAGAMRHIAPRELSLFKKCIFRDLKLLLGYRHAGCHTQLRMDNHW
jgi:hypothetical protein